MEPGFLLIPGPVPLPPRVLEEFSKPARPHYGDAWVKAHSETREMLRYLWSAPDAHVFPIAGPGHAVLEGISLPYSKLGIDAAFTASQKCIAAPAGIAPIAVASSLWESTDRQSIEGWYLNLYTWDRYEREWGEWHPAPTTISSNLFYAFHRALSLLKEEGLKARIARHTKVAAQLRAGLAGLGFTPLGPANLLSNTVACFMPPASTDPNRLVRRLRDDHNIYISGGLGPLRGKTIRIGTMGTQAEPEVVEWLLKAMRPSP